MSVDNYVCTLTEADLAVARDELHEDPKERLGAVETLRTWVNDQKWLKCPTDTSFLLKVLRHRKFSQLGARESLEQYWQVRSENPKWFGDVDTASKDIQELLDLGIFLILPKRERHGRRIMMARQGIIDTGLIQNKWGLDIILKVELCCLDVIAREEQSQVHGMVGFLDQTNVAASTMTGVYNPSNMMKFLKCLQNVFPLRMKQVHMYNQPPLFEAVLSAVKPFMKEKLRNRSWRSRQTSSMYSTKCPYCNLVYSRKDAMLRHQRQKHSDTQEAIQVYPRECEAYPPPQRAYPPQPQQQQQEFVFQHPFTANISGPTEYTKKEFLNPEVREYVRMVSSKQYGVDTTLKPKSKDVPAESFRKLNID